MKWHPDRNGGAAFATQHFSQVGGDFPARSLSSVLIVIPALASIRLLKRMRRYQVRYVALTRLSVLRRSFDADPAKRRIYDLFGERGKYFLF